MTTQSLSKNMRIFFMLLKLRFARLTEFRLSFFGPFFVDSSLFIIQVLIFKTIYANVDSIGGWGQGQMLIFIGTFSLINALNMILYFFGVITIPDKVKNGSLDLYLTKPVSPLFRISFESIDPGSLPLLLTSFAIIGYGVSVSAFIPSMSQIILYTYFVIIMTILWYDMEVILRSLSFFIISVDNITKIEAACLELSFTVPGIALRGFFKLLFYFILPYGIMATIPVQAISGSLSLSGAFLFSGVVLVFTLITALLWKTGLRHYNSASS
jgi:ABC-2 type transport system permease protein